MFTSSGRGHWKGPLVRAQLSFDGAIWRVVKPPDQLQVYGIGGIPWTMHEMTQQKMLVFRR